MRRAGRFIWSIRARSPPRESSISSLAPGDGARPRGYIPTNLTKALLRTPGLERFAKSPRAFVESLATPVRFDTRNTDEILAGTGIVCPPFETYVDQIVNYVRERVREKRERREHRAARRSDETDPQSSSSDAAQLKASRPRAASLRRDEEADEVAQELARVRSLAASRKNGIGVEPFVDETRSPHLDVAAHHAHVDLGMELDAARNRAERRAPRALRDGPGDDHRAGRQRDDRIDMRRIRPQLIAADPSKSGSSTWRVTSTVPISRPRRIFLHLATERLRHQLVTEADPEERRLGATTSRM